jgi:hypothetical protein
VRIFPSFTQDLNALADWLSLVLVNLSCLGAPIVADAHGGWTGHPPRSIYRSIAYRFGRSILYIPIGQLSSEKIKKLRVVHVLDGYARREEAKQYIW